ncbi:uncharacterized protein LOC127208633 [Acomys russatus]|uniref:uncharacterized protein LOC127208633 n=1 Tax=Acomys russatus TaxID=60746 RepID=UPI0021E2A3D1|nr:uncharacterized protein LOC127208633 [Acomys russatus]
MTPAHSLVPIPIPAGRPRPTPALLAPPPGPPPPPRPPSLLTPKFPALSADGLQGLLAPSPSRPRPRPVPAVRARPAVHLAVFRIGTPLLLLGGPELEPPQELVPGGPGARAEEAVLAQLRAPDWVPSDSVARGMPAGTPLTAGARCCLLPP